jgi:hypothetical protein
VHIDGDLPGNLLSGFIGGAATSVFMARRLGRPASPRVVVATAVVWALAMALAGLITDLWYGWTNTFAAGAVSGLGSFPLLYFLKHAVAPAAKAR